MAALARASLVQVAEHPCGCLQAPRCCGAFSGLAPHFPRCALLRRAQSEEKGRLGLGGLKP